MSDETIEVTEEVAINSAFDELDNFEFEDEEEEITGEVVSSDEDEFEDIPEEEEVTEEVSEEVVVTVDTVEDDTVVEDEDDEFEEIPDEPDVIIKASVSPRVSTESPAGSSPAKISKNKSKKKAKKDKVDYAHPQFVKRKAGDKFLKDEEIINITAEFQLDDVTMILVVKKSKTVKAFICDETSYLNACDVTDEVSTITLEDEADFDERAALDIIRKANVKYDLGILTVSPKGDNINTRTLGLKVARALNVKLKVKAESV